MLLHDSRLSEESIRAFFQDVHELYLKVRAPPRRAVARLRQQLTHRASQTMLNPFHTPLTPITSPRFDALVRAAAKKHL